MDVRGVIADGITRREFEVLTRQVHGQEGAYAWARMTEREMVRQAAELRRLRSGLRFVGFALSGLLLAVFMVLAL